MSARRQTLVQLSDDLVDRLDRRAAQSGLSRSALIRETLERALAEDQADEVSRAISDGYARVPQSDGSDLWGNLDAWTEQNARRNLAGLGFEEEDG